MKTINQENQDINALVINKRIGDRKITSIKNGTVFYTRFYNEDNQRKWIPCKCSERTFKLTYPEFKYYNQK